MNNIKKLNSNYPVVFITDSDFSNTDKSFEYLLWFQPSLWWIILSEEEIFIFLDGRYYWNTANINKELLKWKIWNNSLKINYLTFENWENKLLDSIISKLWKNIKIYLENNIASKYYDYIKTNTNNAEIELIEAYFWEKRIIKQDNEVENIEKAIEIIDNTFIYIEKLNNSWDLLWKTELQVRAIVISKIMEYWWSWESFDTIVAFAQNSAIPHHSAGETIIGVGVLLIDMWALYNWYCSDFTRTFWVWEQNKEYDEFIKIKDIVKKAHNEAFKLAYSLISWKELDFIARNIIENEWYWEYYIHSLGHWVWLDIHESPRVSKTSVSKLLNWMVFTIEPWIYLPWKFWIRLEDIVFMKKNKLEKFTKVDL